MSRLLLAVAAGLLSFMVGSTEILAKGGHGGHSSGGHSGHKAGNGGNKHGKGGHKTGNGGNKHGKDGHKTGNGGNKHGKDGHKTGSGGHANPFKTHGPKDAKGKVHRGRSYRHWVFGGKWRGWQKRHWFSRYHRYLYWAPGEGCWYSYDSGDQTFVPCDCMTSRDPDDYDTDDQTSAPCPCMPSDDPDGNDTDE